MKVFGHFNPPFTPEAALITHNLDAEWAEYKATGSIAVRNRIVEAYMPLVRDLADKLHTRLPSVVELDDLVADGSVGLISAVTKFQPERGLKFHTYAGKRIFGAMVDGLRDFDWVPRITRMRTKLIGETVAAFEAEHGRPPTPEETRRKLQLSRDGFRRITGDQARPMTSLSHVVFETDSEKETTTLQCLWDEHHPAPDRRLERRDIIGVIISEFRVTDSLFIRLYYLEGLGLKQIGKALGDVTESAMSAYKKHLTRRLRERFAPEVLRTLKARAA